MLEKLNKTKIVCKEFLLLLGIFNSNSMENFRKNEINETNKIQNENQITGNKIIDIGFQNLEKELFENIKKLSKEFEINKIYKSNYNDELKTIVEILNNLKYSHKYKFCTCEGIEELRNIYHILCEIY